MLEATTALAVRADRAEIDFCALAGQPCQSLLVAGGRAVYASPGSPLNKVLGLGLGTPVTDADLDAIESFYSGYGSPVTIELCPLAAPDVPARLSKRGYIVQAFENELARAVPQTPLDARDRSGALRVVEATDADREIWLDVVARGFALGESAAATDAADPAVVATGRAMMKGFLHPAITRYLVWIGNEPAGGGSTWVQDGVVGIAGTTTLAAFRRRGVQSALVAHSVNDAFGKADLAIASTAPGSFSQRTFERLGFQVLYTRVIFVKNAAA